VKVEDTWYVDGMVGTGSNDIVIDDVLVPEGRSVSIADMVSGRAHGSRLHAGPLYRTPMIPILMLAASMPVVGQARAVLRGFRERLEEHVRLGSTRQQAQKPASQMRLARAHLELRQAELLLRDVAADVMQRRDAALPEERARWSSSVTHAVHQARGVTQAVAEASGASAHFLDRPLQRALRDANVASCHVAFDRDAQQELYGRLLLGLEPTSALF
jgi:alkylation response protein AidB-like acyl-CoA dehydrogenase